MIKNTIFQMMSSLIKKATVTLKKWTIGKLFPMPLKKGKMMLKLIKKYTRSPRLKLQLILKNKIKLTKKNL